MRGLRQIFAGHVDFLFSSKSIANTGFVQVFAMSRLPVFNALLFLALFVANTVLSAPRGDGIPDRSAAEEFPETREAEVLEYKNRLSKENIPREDGLLHIAKSNQTKTNGKTSEVKDLVGSHVKPDDDDDTALREKKSKTNASKDNLPPEAFPNDETVKSISHADPKILNEEMPRFKLISKPNPPTVSRQIKMTETTTVASTLLPTDVTEQTKLTESTMIITTIPVEPETTTEAISPKASTEAERSLKPKESENPEETTKPIETTSMKLMIPTILTTSIIESPTTSTMSPAEAMLHKKKEPKSESMPTGIVILITAISFSIVSIGAYIVLIVQRRYLEWRHGNRELLVNNFDTTDITNFETENYHGDSYKYNSL